TFNANGGTGTMSPVEYAGTYTLPTCTFTAPTGKQFKGWSTSANGNVIEGTTINITADTELFAIWEDTQTPPINPDEPEQPQKPEDTNKGLGVGAIIGIVLASLVVLGTGGFALVWFVIKKKSWADFIAIFKKK
ncbi:MAG: InlB B-repeat-containing protein, partial [Clostridia bacterium]|nr:InlB B-repeat-containing protein [Clostridia bacterium]